ncbi:uncharacterized protein [Henckelia pumila]|uniref:uncharacterized protein n=1 Tax=Henckelia pumila TaxID=405737 RepID=UPI003C6DE181
MLMEYQRARRELLCAKPVEPLLSPYSWSLPPPGKLQLDVDVSFDDNNNVSGIGGIVRDPERQPVVAYGKKLVMSGSVVLGELLSIKAGMEFLREKDLHQVLIVSHSLLAVQAVTSPKEDLSYVGLCVANIKKSITELGNISLFHARRSANEVAHSLTKFSWSSPTPFCWVFGNFSSWLIKLVNSDLISIK